MKYYFLGSDDGYMYQQRNYEYNENIPPHERYEWHRVGKNNCIRKYKVASVNHSFTFFRFTTGDTLCTEKMKWNGTVSLSQHKPSISESP